MARSYADLTGEDIRDFAIEMFGDRGLNAARSNGKEAVFGTKGSIVVALTGQWRGRYRDWENDERGWVLPEDLRPKTHGKKKKAPPLEQEGEPEPEPEPSRSVDSDAEKQRKAEEAEAARRAAEEAARRAAEALAAKRAHILQEWERAVPLPGTPGERYLVEHRKLPMPAYLDQMRWLADHQLSGDHGFRHPALLVPFVGDDALGVIGIGAVRIDPETGAKAALEVPKPSYHAGKDLGVVAHVQLGDPDSSTLVIAEGLETGLTRLLSAPCDLRVCWGSLRAVEPREHTRRVEIIADRDKVQAARKLARTYADMQGVQAYVVIPPRDTGPKGDLNDVVQMFDSEEAMERLQVVLGEAEHIEPAKGSRATRQLDISHNSDVEIAQLLLERLEDLYGPLVVADGDPWYWDGSKFVALQGSVFVRHVHSADGIMYTTPSGDPAIVKISHGRVGSIGKCLLGYRESPSFFSEDREHPAIAVTNGVLLFDRDSGEYALADHARRFRNRHVLGGRYLPQHEELLLELQAGSQRAARAFRETLLGTLLFGCFCEDPDAAEKESLLQEVAGVVMAGWGTRMPRPKALVAYGPKAQNGKSQWSDLLRGMVPPGAAVTVSPTDFGREYFSYKLAGALLNACDELPEKAVESDRFKAAITGEEMPARQIYREAGFIRPIALHWYTTNQLPRFRDGVDAGVLRRLLFLAFNRRIPDCEQIADIGRRIAAEEMDLLLVWAAMGLKRFLAQGSQFTVPASSNSTLEEFLHEADPVRAWLAERVFFDPAKTEVRLSAKAAYSDYVQWARDAGHRDAFMITLPTMGKRLVRALPDLVTVKSNGVMHYIGMTLLPPADFDDVEN